MPSPRAEVALTGNGGMFVPLTLGASGDIALGSFTHVGPTNALLGALKTAREPHVGGSCIIVHST